MGAEVAYAIDGVDATEAQLAESVARVHLVEGVDVDIFVEIGDKGLPPVPCYKARK